MSSCSGPSTTNMFSIVRQCKVSIIHTEHSQRYVIGTGGVVIFIATLLFTPRGVRVVHILRNH